MSTVSEHSSPFVELQHAHPLVPAEIAALTVSNSSNDPDDVIKATMRAYTAFAVRHAREELLKVALVDDTVMRIALDAAFNAFIPVLKSSMGPVIVQSYIDAFHAVNEGDVPATLLYSIADEHALRVGKYFNETSTDALVQGFNTLLNKQVPNKVAAERVLMGFGLTPRQMTGLTVAAHLQPEKINSPIKLNLKRKLKAYIVKSLTDRLQIFGKQEKHNLSQQANQVAWMWLMEKGRIPANAQKMWLTAKDEKVCVICGPMHGKKVDLNDQFVLPNNAKLYVPGAHVNCRCELRLMVVPTELIGKADKWDPQEHPRGGNPENRGQFSRYRNRDQPVKEFAPDPRVETFVSEADRLRLADKLEQELAIERAARIPKLSDLERNRPKLTGLNPHAGSLRALKSPSLKDALLGASLKPGLGELQPGLAPLTASPVSVEARAYQSLAGLAPSPLAMGHLSLPPLREPKAREILYGNAVPLGGMHLGLGDPMQIRFPEQMPKGMIRIDEGGPNLFYTDELDSGQIIEHHAAAQRDEVVANMMGGKWGQQRNGLTKTDWRYPGETFYHSVDEPSIEMAVSALAHEDDPSYRMLDYQIEWQSTEDPDHVEYETVDYAELAKRLGIEKKDLNITMYRAGYGHKGKTFRDSKHTIKMTGEFEVVERHELSSEEKEDMGIGNTLSVTIFDIEPIVAKPEVGFEEVTD